MTIDSESACPTGEAPVHMPANEWEASGNILLYTEMNGRFARQWREEFANNPTVKALLGKYFDY